LEIEPLTELVEEEVRNLKMKIQARTVELEVGIKPLVAI
jgi:hypothetical protein